MTLEQAKELLSQNQIEFKEQEYSSEAEYWLHLSMFPYLESARPCKVIAVVIESNNGKKNIEIQFNETENGFQFEDLSFGDFSTEMDFLDCTKEELPNELLNHIRDIKNGSWTVISAYNITKKRHLGNAVFDLNDDSAFLNKSAFQKTMEKIEKPKNLFQKILRTELQYEIYDWNSYRLIKK